MIKRVKRFLTEEDGVTAIEYALIAALVALVIIVGARMLGTSLNSHYSDVATKVSEVANQGGE